MRTKLTANNALASVADMSVDQPEVRFDWVSRTRGPGFIEETHLKRSVGEQTK